MADDEDDYMDDDEMDVMDSDEDDEDLDDGDDGMNDIEEAGGGTAGGGTLAGGAPAAASAPGASDATAAAAAAAQQQQQQPPAQAPPPPAAEEDAAIARRRAIQQIMRDTTLSDQEKRMRIQNLMSNGRTQVAPPPAPVLPQSESDNKCVHYERNCKLVAPCCNKAFGCRICHDELSPTDHPPMNRFMVQEVVCKVCNTQQATSNHCINCKAVFAEYHCRKCNLWMSLAKKPFHCDKCGFCRVGGREAFRHCDECCMCISVTVYDNHQCFKDKYKNNCPVCREDMFSSRQSPQDLPCGHAIHAHCFRKLAGFDYRCPICKKTVVSQQSMAAAWEARARDIAEHPMPADLQRIVDIMCNDCETKSHGRNWHFLGIQCPSCSSFNTVVEQVISSGPASGEQPNNADGNNAPNQPHSGSA